MCLITNMKLHTTSTNAKRQITLQKRFSVANESVALPVPCIWSIDLDIHRTRLLHRMQDVAGLKDMITHSRNSANFRNSGRRSGEDVKAEDLEES